MFCSTEALLLCLSATVSAVTPLGFHSGSKLSSLTFLDDQYVKRLLVSRVSGRCASPGSWIALGFPVEPTNN